MTLRRIITNLMNRFIDKHTTTYTTPYVRIRELFYRTLRYKLAAKGFPITSNEKFLISLKNKHKGKRCFIIGNGPSLNNCDLTLLKDEITFGFNSIFLHYDKMGFVPSYYIVEDVLVAEDRRKEINNLKGSVKFFGNHINYCIDNTKDTYWINVLMNYEDYENFPHFSENALRKIWVGGTVTYQAMQMAFYMGFTEVYMIGYDHSYTVPKSADVKGFVIESTESDPNHFHPDYFGKGYRWHDPQVDRMELAYIKAKYHFEKNSRKIYNATVGGQLEVFDRIDYNKLF